MTLKVPLEKQVEEKRNGIAGTRHEYQLIGHHGDDGPIKQTAARREPKPTSVAGTNTA